MQLEDIRTAESITAAELAVGDFHLVFDESTNKWKKLLHSEGNKENKPVAGTPVKAVKAYGETNLTGATNNDVRWTAATAGVSLASIAYAAPTAVATTVASASGVAVSVQTGTKARMLVSGTLTSDGATPVVPGTLRYAGISGGKVYFTGTGAALTGSGTEYELRWDAILWRLAERLDGVDVAEWQSASDVALPDSATGWSTVGSSTGTPTITAATSSAAQVIAAVAADAASAALMVGTNKSGNDGTGAVATLAATLLTALSNPVAGVDGTPATAGDQFMDETYLYTALTDMTVSTLTGWMTSPLTALA